MSRQYFKKVQPQGSISPLPSTLVYDFNLAKNDLSYFENGRAFFHAKITLTDSTGNLITANGKYLRWNPLAAIFNTARTKINGSLVETVNNFAQCDSLVKRLSGYSEDWLNTTGKLMGLDNNDSRQASAKAFKIQDLVFKPSCMSLFNIETLAGGNNIRIELDVSNINKCVVGTDCKVSLDMFDLYIFTEENSISYVDSKEVTMELKEYKCELVPYIGVSSLNQLVKVEPTVNQITYALQLKDDTTIFDNGKFGNISTTYVSYNNVNYPPNMNVFNNTANIENTGFKLATVFDLITTGSFFNNSGYEGETYMGQLGSYIVHELSNDSNSIATSANIYVNFKDADTTGGMLVIMSSNTYSLKLSYDSYGNGAAPVKVII